MESGKAMHEHKVEQRKLEHQVKFWTDSNLNGEAIIQIIDY